MAEPPRRRPFVFENKRKNLVRPWRKYAKGDLTALITIQAIAVFFASKCVLFVMHKIRYDEASRFFWRSSLRDILYDGESLLRTGMVSIRSNIIVLQIRAHWENGNFHCSNIILNVSFSKMFIFISLIMFALANASLKLLKHVFTLAFIIMKSW